MIFFLDFGWNLNYWCGLLVMTYANAWLFSRCSLDDRHMRFAEREVIELETVLERARTDCFGAWGSSASLTLGSPCRRPPSPLRGTVVEPVLLFVGGSNRNV